MVKKFLIKLIPNKALNNLLHGSAKSAPLSNALAQSQQGEFMRTIVFLIFVLTSSIAFADTLPDKEAGKKLAESVMNKVAEGKTPEGLDLTKSYLIIPMSEFEVMKNQFALQAPVIEQRFGKTIGVEPLRVKEVGQSLMLVEYLQKFEKHIMVWKFYFYKTNDGWVLNTFNFDDSIQQVFSTP